MTGRITFLPLMLFGVMAAIALGAPAVVAASPPLRAPANTSLIPVPDPVPIPVPGPALKPALVVGVTFAGGSTPASTPDKSTSAIADQIRDGLNPFLATVSRGRFPGYSPVGAEVTVQPSARMCSDRWVRQIASLGSIALRAKRVDPSRYDAVVFYFRGIPTCDWGGKASFPGNGRSVWLNGDISLSTLTHEFGHHLGLGHAGTQFCVDNSRHPVPLHGPLEARCTQRKYGNPYSAMGSDEGAGGFPRGYAAAQLNQLGWNVGTETISAGDPTVTKVLTLLEDHVPGSTQALRLVDGIRTLWLEFRANPFSVQEALLVSVEEPSLAGDAHVAPFLLDMTPLDGDDARSPGSRTSQELPVGQAWTNPLGHMTITLNSVDTHQASVTVQSVPGPVPDPPPGPGPGPGTVVVPEVRGQTLSIAERDIAAAGLVLGTVGTTVDCDQIDLVVSQSPAHGIQLPPGATVDLKMGIPHPRGCGIPE